MAHDTTEITELKDGKLVVKAVELTGAILSKASTREITTIVNTSKGKELAVKVTGIGGGGGGGGDVTEDEIIIKSDTIPTASSSYAGYVYMFTGGTNGTYTHGYIYECKPTYTDTAVAFSSQNITWALNSFLSWLAQAGVSYNRITHGTMSYEASGDLWTVEGFDADGIKIFTWKEYTQDLKDAGCIFTTDPQDGDSSTFTFTTSISGYIWARLDVQPGGSSATTWGSITGTLSNQTDLQTELDKKLSNTSTGTDSITIGGTATSYSDSVNIGVGSKADNYYATAIGKGSNAKSDSSTAIGYNAEAQGNYSIAIKGKTNGNYALAIGANARALANGAVQLLEGANTTANTIQIKDAQFYNLSTGKMVMARLPIEALTQAEYDAKVSGGTIDANTLYLITPAS